MPEPLPGHLLEVDNLSMDFPVGRGWLRRGTRRVRAVDGVSFRIRRGGTLALVGESGCGKSTTGRLILRLHEPTAGRILHDGIETTRLRGERLRRFRPRMQMIFQDPLGSLNPRMTVGDIIAEPLVEHRRGDSAFRRARVRELMEWVGLDPALSGRYPHEFSGGQRQRVGIARALALEPELVVCDEPLAALDVSIQAQIVNLLADLQRRLGLTYLFISHDLAMVRHFADEVAVMYLGRIVEHAPAEEIFARPAHPYTRALLSAIPVPDPDAERQRRPILLPGDVPDPGNSMSGCLFSTRCPIAMEYCRAVAPELQRIGPSCHVACHRAD